LSKKGLKGKILGRQWDLQAIISPFKEKEQGKIGPIHMHSLLGHKLRN